MTELARPYEFLARAAPSGRGTVTAEVTQALRHAIVTLRLRPGAQLDKGAICERLDVSRFPVSEALARLSAEGLVDIAPQRGSSVSLVRIADVQEFMIIRKALESEALRVLVQSDQDDILLALSANMTAQRDAAAREAQDDFHELDIAFHDLIFAAMGFSRVRSIIDSVRANLDRARRLIVTPRRLNLTIAEHALVFDAIGRRDAAGAQQAIRAHVDAVVRELLVFARDQPELFADGDRYAHADAPGFPFG